jgi:WD40 repeat protein
MAGAAIFLGLQAQQSATAAQTNFEKAESQRLAGESSTLLQVSGSGDLASLLALRGLQEHYSPQADMALQRAGRLYFGELNMAHPRQVDQFSISPDGAHLLTYARDAKVRLWNLADGSLVREVDTASPFGTVRYSPDGTRYAIASDAGVELHDAQTGAVLWKVGGGFDAQFVSDGQTIFVSRPDGIDVLSAADGSVSRSLPIQNDGFALAPDGRQLIVGDGVYNTSDGSLAFRLVGHTNAVPRAAFSPDGKLIATGSWDESARIWDRATGQSLQTLVGHTEILFEVAFSPDSKRLVSGSLDNTARIWDVSTGKQLRELTGHTAGVYGAEFTPDGNHVVTSSADGSARLWDLTQPIESETISGHNSFVYGVAFSPDGKTLFTGSADGTGMLSDPVTLASTTLPYTGARVDRAAFSPDARYLLLGPETKPPELWDPATMSLIAPLDGGGGGQTAAFSGDGAYMVAGAAPADATNPDASAIGLWNVSTRTLVRTFQATGFTIGEITPDGRYVIVTTDNGDHNITVYDAATGAQVRVLENGPAGVSALAVSPDSKHILTGSRDNNARIFNIETGDVQKLVGHTNIIWGTAFSPDGSVVLTGSQDRTARLWDVTSGAELRRFASHDYSAIGGVTISPDGKNVAIGNFDGSTQLSPIDLNELEDGVCGRLLRDFTDAERVIYEIPDKRATCGSGAPY